MQLSKLEIKGFKSFGEKVTVHFDEGITGIVGPNGCGKSNVVDAIRWVLGEQKTKALRSDKMENVIFNGTRTRKPLQMAEVSLTFNNTKNLLPTEYSHVTITRRYYRSGESEYLLNGVSCRLKDITSLFLDTGIGSDSYAIIELKMVDDILNDKDNSRRTLFEEAAGISKFKIRKKQTLRKLEETDKDLERVEDLLFEITKNLKTLEKQAKQTERYFQLKEEYKKTSVAFGKHTLKAENGRLQKLEENITSENDKRQAHSVRILEKEADVEALKTSLVQLEKLLASRQKVFNEHINKIRIYESEKKIKNERLRYLTTRHTSLFEEINNDKKNSERAEFSIQSLKSELLAAANVFEETQKLLKVYKDDYETQKQSTTSIQQNHQQLTGSLRQKQDEAYQLNKNLEIATIQLKSLLQELEKTSTDEISHSANLDQFEIKLYEVTTRLEAKQQKYDTAHADEENLQKDVESVSQEIEAVRERLTSTSRQLDARQNEYNLTKSMVDNLEGFPEAIKFLRKNTSWGKDIPLLSDIITCDEKYRLAIESFLEGVMNYYVADTELQALQAVNLLSDASKGKANFFLLAAFAERQPPTEYHYPNCIPALSIAEYDSKYESLVASLLQDVFIVTSHQDQLPADHESIFITQNGKLTRRKNSLSGGSVGLFEGKRIGRAKNLEKLHKEIKLLTDQVSEIKTTSENLNSKLHRLRESTQKQQIETLRKEIQVLGQEHTSVKMKMEQFASMLQGQAFKKEDIQKKITKLQSDIAQGTPISIEKNHALEELQKLIAAASAESVSHANDLAKKSLLFNQHNLVYHQQQNRLKSLEQEIGYKQSTFDTSRERLHRNQDELKKAEDEIRQLHEKTTTSDDELLEFYKEKDNIESGVSEAEKGYYGARAGIDDVEKAIKEIRKLKEGSDDIIQQVQNKLNETKLGIASVQERLAVEFNIDPADLYHDEPLENELRETNLQQAVSQAKSALEKIGPINPLAMDAYNEIQERNTFITTQRDDLVKAKNSLLQTISEIDLVAKETFMEAFHKIRENFILVFRSLFTEEDTCDLLLVDASNPLDSAIDIIARPKGKRPLTINQLSGGEKTLTAISLLFAIYLIKPAPFCIFDEVDAPLDDANIDKFNTIIKKFSADSQFIIVTHNKRTMASTDVIYGITMIEQGISRLVPVDLRSLA